MNLGAIIRRLRLERKWTLRTMAEMSLKLLGEINKLFDEDIYILAYFEKKAITTTPVRMEDGSLKTVMPKIDGKFIRCECGCNVFHYPDETNLLRLQCNSCDAKYTVER